MYLSFELVENIKPLDNDTSIHQITQRMSKVHDILNQQETEMDRLVGYTNTHINVITKHVQDAVSRIICETIVIIVTGIVSLWVLRREMRRGYELLV